MDNRYLTSGKVARLVGVSKGTVLRAVQRGDLVPALKMPGGSLRFVPTAVDAYARTLGIELPAGAARTSHQQQANPRRGRYSARRAAGAAEPVYTWRTFNEGQSHAAFQAGGERGASMDTSSDGADALVSNVLAMLADCLRAGATGISREMGGQWQIEQMHDRMGMGMAEGASDEFSAAYGTSAASTGLDMLIVEDARQDTRFTNIAGATLGIGSFMGVLLSDPSGRVVGALFAAYPHVRPVTSEEIALLRLTGQIITQVWELASARQGRGELPQPHAAAMDRERHVAGSTDHAMWQLDPNGATTLLNDRMASLLGYSLDELAATSLLDHLDEVDRARARELLERESPRPATRFDADLRRKDGTPLTVSITVNPLLFGEGLYAGAHVLVSPAAGRSASTE